jgi:hypothetical protein
MTIYCPRNIYPWKSGSVNRLALILSGLPTEFSFGRENEEIFNKDRKISVLICGEGPTMPPAFESIKLLSKLVYVLDLKCDNSACITFPRIGATIFKEALELHMAS